LKIYFLGTGTSQGIPVIGSDHPVCKSDNPKDKRLRVSVMISWDNTTIVIDCGPDFRQQMLASGCTKIDAILFTHEHADHTAGLDDIRPFNFRQGALPIFAQERVIKNLEKRFDYIFETENRYPGAPTVQINEIIDSVPFTLKDKTIIPIKINHGSLPILGFRIDDFAYLTDVKTIDSEEIEKLAGVKVLVVNALREQPHETHFNLEEALDFIKIVQPQKTYLTHISHLFGFHDEIQKKLPANVFLAYDNLEIEVV
jgi:phosphoribosyl 1,2-cyclic phosphate phosphodiesterase